MREESSAARGAMALSVAGIVTKIISILYTPILTAILGEAGYGVYTKVLDVFLFVYAVTTVGVQPAVAKVVAELNATGKYRGAIRTLKVSRKMYFAIGSIGGLILMLLAFPIANLIDAPKIPFGIIALGPCVLITSILSAYRGFMQGNNNMKVIAISQILEQLINVILSLLCAYILMGSGVMYGVAGAQIGTSVGALIAILFIIGCYHKENYEEEAYELDTISKVSDSKIKKKLFIYSIPIIMSAGLQNFGGLVDMGNVTRRLLSIGLSDKAANILYGHYGLYKTLIGVPMVIIAAISVTILPAISKYRALNDKKEIRQKIRFGYRTSLAISIPAAVGLAMVADPMYISLFRRTSASGIMKIGSFILILMAITQIQTSVLQGINKFYYILLTFSVGILFKIGLNYFFVAVPKINIYGVLIGNCVWYLIPAIMNHRKICKVTKVKLSVVKLFFKPLFSSALMALSIFIVQRPIVFIQGFTHISRPFYVPILLLEVAVGGFVYVYTMVLIGGIKKNDIDSISPRIFGIMPRFLRVKIR